MSDEVLERELVEAILQEGPPCVSFSEGDEAILLYENDRINLLAHDAALRQRIEELEEALENIASYGPAPDEPTNSAARLMKRRARRALERGPEGGGEG